VDPQGLAKVENALLQNKSLLRSSILLAPHHGSKTSNSPLFLDIVNPQKIVVSAGRFRPSLFPSAQLRSHCRENNIPLFNTAELGAVTVKNTDVGVALDTFKKIPDAPVQLSLFYDTGRK
jgi:competence protein ComEC